MRSSRLALFAAALAAVLTSVTRADADPPPPAPAPAPPPAAANPSDPSADAIADRVQAFYDKTKTFSADFAQPYTIKAYNRSKDNPDRVVFEKPGKMSC